MKDIPSLDKIFDLPIVDQKQYPIAEIQQSKSVDIDNDYQLARTTLRNLIVKGESTLDEMINLAKNSEHPRTYEVAGQLIKTMSDVAKDLLSLQKQAKELDSGTQDNNPSIGTQNNIVFAGTTTELLKLLKNEKPIDG
jgi:hypothetical protein